jgi:hypothetical protein
MQYWGTVDLYVIGPSIPKGNIGRASSLLAYFCVGNSAFVLLSMVGKTQTKPTSE